MAKATYAKNFRFFRVFRVQKKKQIGVLKNSCRAIRVAQISILSLIFADFMCKIDNYYGKIEENCKIVFFAQLFCVLLCTGFCKEGKWFGFINSNHELNLHLNKDGYFHVRYHMKSGYARIIVIIPK